MRILLLAQFFPPDIGGEERHVYNLAATLASRGHVVSVATQRIGGRPDMEVLPTGVHVYRFGTVAMRLPGIYSTERPHHPPLPDPIAVRELRTILFKCNPEVVHAHNWAVNSVLPIPRELEGGVRFGLVLTLHDYSQVCATKRLMRDGTVCEGPSLRRCVPCSAQHYGAVVGAVTATSTSAMRVWKDRAIDHVICVSNSVARGNQIADRRTTTVIPNFIPDNIITPRADIGLSEPYDAGSADLPDKDFLLFVGDLSAEKGVPILLAAYELLDTAERPALLLVGRRTPDTPATFPPGVKVNYEWPHDRIIGAFKRCTAAILPSVWPDPCPTTVLEAMASGSPVVTTSIGGMVDMVSGEDSGLLVPPGDAPGLAVAITRLLSNPDLRRRLVAGAQKKVSEFTASRVAERLEGIYKNVAISQNVG